MASFSSISSCPCFIVATPLFPPSYRSKLQIRHTSHERGHIRRTTLKRQRLTCNINKTTEPGREDEIASKIAALRKQKRLKYRPDESSTPNPQPRGDTNIETPPSSNPPEHLTVDYKTVPSETVPPVSLTQTELSSGTEILSEEAPENSIFSQLPDWKKEQVLESQIADAENFFNRRITTVPSTTPTNPKSDSETKIVPTLPSNDDDEKYKPKVSTWGVFPRPDNISRTYGGGRRLELGGTDLNSKEQKIRDQKIAERLAAYRSSRGVDMELERAHENEITKALEESEKFMRRGEAMRALKSLNSVSEWCSDASRLGGKVWLALALAYESSGQREKAKDIYQNLRANPFDEIASKAKQLQQGFSAMQSLGVEDDDNRTGSGIKVMDFTVPDLNFASDKRYETVVMPSSSSSTGRGEKIGIGINFALTVLLLSPVLFVSLLTLLHRD